MRENIAINFFPLAIRIEQQWVFDMRWLESESARRKPCASKPKFGKGRASRKVLRPLFRLSFIAVASGSSVSPLFFLSSGSMGSPVRCERSDSSARQYDTRENQTASPRPKGHRRAPAPSAPKPSATALKSASTADRHFSRASRRKLAMRPTATHEASLAASTPTGVVSTLGTSRSTWSAIPCVRRRNSRRERSFMSNRRSEKRISQRKPKRVATSRVSES